MNNNIECELNGLRITIDSDSGSIVKMEYSGPGDMLNSISNGGGLIDVAYPDDGFEALRLSSGFSKSADITVQNDEIKISISRLGANRSWYKPKGDVSAEISIKAMPDARSLSITCSITNNSRIPIKQVVFPDLNGLLPFGGVDNTILKTCGFGSAPFRELKESGVDSWYAVNNSLIEYTSGGMFDPMWLRWLDLSGLNGGFSLFPKLWGWDKKTKTVLKMSQSTGKIRLMSLHDVEINPGEKWNSCEYILTPHQNGWAKGIEVYKDWIKNKIKREYPIPKHIKEGLGFRTMWMCQNQPNDPDDVVWRLKDIPKVAKEAAKYGLNEIVLWAWHQGFEAPFPPPYRHLGTETDLYKAVKESREIGVNVAPFISVIQANNKTAPKYGLAITNNNGWTYHTEMLPRWNPSYATGFACIQVGPANQKWQDEVVQSCKTLIDSGIASVSWDQYFSGQEQPDIYTLTSRIRSLAKKVDPESTFSAEELWNMEIDCNYLDYTWNWRSYGDCQAFTNAFPAPRINCNINNSETEVKFAFMDNLFLNVWPSKPDSINGSDYIDNNKQLADALDQCWNLRKQFMKYFTDGTLIGNCFLTQITPGIRVSSYVLPDRLLTIILNQSGKTRKFVVNFDLKPWLKSKEQKYILKSYNGQGIINEEKVMSSRIKSFKTKDITSMDFAVYEFIAE